MGNPMLKRALLWALVVCITLAVSGFAFYYFGYRTQAGSEQSTQILPASKVLRSVTELTTASNNRLPHPQTLFEAADSALTSMERIDIHLNVYKTLSPLFVAMMVSLSRGSERSETMPQTISTVPFNIDKFSFYDTNLFIRNEWHIDFRRKLVLYRKLQDDTTHRVPPILRGMLTSNPIWKAAYDGHRWVIIYDEAYYHPYYPPESGWRYHVVLLRSYEEGKITAVDNTPSIEYLLPLLGLHRAYLFAGNNMRNLLDIDQLASTLDIPEGWTLQTQGLERVGRYECYRVKATNQQMRSEVWLWFCPSLQYRCIRAEVISGETRESSKFVIVAEIPEWITLDTPIPLPKRLQVARYISTSPSSSEYALLDKSEIFVDYLSPMAESAYRLSIPSESAHVSDNIANRVYTLGKKVPIAPRRSFLWFLGGLIVFLLSLGGVGIYCYRRRRVTLNG